MNNSLPTIINCDIEINNQFKTIYDGCDKLIKDKLYLKILSSFNNIIMLKEILFHV